MALATLQASTRAGIGKGHNRRLRAAGKVPAVVYGAAKEPTAVSVDPKQVVAVLNGSHGKNTLLDLVIEGEDAPRLVLIKDYQVQPWKRTLIHVDFWEVIPDSLLILDVPFRRIGKAAVEKLGGRVQIIRRTIKVRCKPAHIPAAIEVDVTGLPAAIASFPISQIPMPEGVEALYKIDYNVMRIKLQSKADAAAEAAEAAEAEGDGEAVEAATDES